MAVLTFPAAMRLLTQKRHQDVYNLAIEALQKNDKNPLAFFFLGMVADDHGQHSKALELFAKASEHGPQNARYHAFHAKALLTLGRKVEAKTRADRAWMLKIDDGFVADMIGTVYSRTAHHKLAVPAFKKAVQLNPKWAVFQFNLGAAAQFTGDIKTAKAAYVKAVSIDPKFYRAWFSLASLETQSDGDNHLTALEPLFAAAKHDPDGQLLIGHAIAKTLEDMGKFSESLDWLKRAKAMRNQHIRHDTHAMKAMFTAAKDERPEPPAEPHQLGDITPIFIVGLPRTGTTLVDRIISSHPKAVSAGELDLFAQIIEGVTRVSRLQAPQFFSAARAADLGNIGNIYRQEIQNLSHSAAALIDKTPMNFFYAGLIRRALPNAKIIALRRGAMDSCLSNYRQLFALHDPRFDYALSLSDTVAYYREFDALMALWRQTLPTSQFLEIRYEDIIDQQELQTRRLLDFCGLDWDPVCLNFHDNTASVDTASSVQVRQPLYSGAVGRWKKYAGKLADLEAELGSLADS